MSNTTKTQRAIETLAVKIEHEVRNRRPMTVRGTRSRSAEATRSIARGEREELRALCCALRALRNVK